MSDPLSIAGSIAGLISVADVVFRLVFKYARSAVNAKEELKNLVDEIQVLAGVLQSLRLLASGLEAEGQLSDPTIRVHHLGTLSSTLSRLQQRVEKADTKFENGSNTQQRLQQLKWPFSTGETKKLLDDLTRQKSTISLALSADSLRKLQLCLANQEELSQTLSTIAETVKRIEIKTQITLNDHKKAVLDFFMKVSPQPNLETSVKLRHSMTGLWLTGSPGFTTWLDTPASKLWLSGIPGAGKTVLAGAVIQDAITHSDSRPEVGVAFFFCDYKESRTWKIVNILGAMASQLGQQNDDAYNRLQTYYDQLHPTSRLEKSPDPDDLRAKITEMSEHFKQTIVVVDGLDECGDSTDDVVETLSKLADYTPNLSMALFSRHEVNIQGWLRDDFDHIPIAARSDDVRLYVGAEMEKRIQNRRLQITDMKLKDEIMNKLVNGAKGMFRWVACQLDYLCDCVNDADRLKALSELPPDLPATYRRLLERVDKKPARVKSLVQMCLQFIAYASPSLTILQLQQAVSTPEPSGVLLDKSDLISEDQIARRCSSLIRKSENGEYFEFSHFSVKEFLTDASLLNSSALKGYFLSKARSHTLLATQCLRFLQLKNFERLPEASEKETVHIYQRNLENPFYEYAAVLWPKFARGHFEDPILFNLAKSLFQRTKTIHFIAWCVEFLRHIYGVSNEADEMWIFPYSEGDDAGSIESYVRSVTDDCFSPLHLAAALYFPEICKFLRDEKLDLNHPCAWGSPLELATISLAAFFKVREDLSDVPFDIHHAWCADLDLWSDIALENMLTTIELLVGAGAAVTKSSSQPMLNLLDLSFLLAAVFSDLSAASKFVSLGVEPSSKSPDRFSRCMSIWEDLSLDFLLGTDKEKHLEATLHSFLSSLISTRVYTTDIGRKIASIAWSTASRFSFSLTSDPGLIGLDPACAEDALRAKAMVAVIEDDVETLQNCLADEKFDISGTFYPDTESPYFGCSLLHVAVNAEAASASQILLDLGCDMNAPNSDGNLPIHLFDKHEDRSTLDVFLQKGASHLATDSSGKNLWHRCVCSSYSGSSTLERLLQLNQDQTTEALLARTSSGETPLLMGLKADASGNVAAKLLLIIDHCAGKPHFWRAHVPVLAAAAEFGSETVIEHLLQAGAEPNPVTSDNFTPLHRLGSHATPECAQMLKELYPDAHKLRFQGRTPLEMCIERHLKSGKMVKQELLVVLATPHALSSQDTGGETVWSFCCKEIPIRSASREKGYIITSHFNHLLLILLRLGAMVSYEETKRQSGILPLFSSLGLKWKQHRHYTTVISRETLSAIILESGYWEDAKKSPVAVVFLKTAIMDGYLEAVRLLLEHGVSVHQRVDQTSAMESAVEKVGTAYQSKATASVDSKEVFLALLSHATAEEMKSYSPHGLGLGLLHMVVEAQDDRKTLTRWLLKELIGRGVDVNGEARFKPGYTPLVHHLSQGSFETAEILLDLGANPSANGAFDLVRAAITKSGVSFLTRLLRYSKETRTQVQWNGIATCSLELEGSSRNIQGVTSLHYIALQGLTEILDLYIEEGLLGDINVTTADGYTAIHLAAINDQAAAIHRLQIQGASLAMQSHDGSTALHLAVRTKSLSAVKILLELGAKGSPDAVAMTPRMYASALKDEDMIQLLDRHLPLDVETSSSFVDVNCISGKRMKFLARSFEDAITRDDLEECQRLHRAGYSLNTSMPRCHGCSPLVKALRWKRLHIVDWLLQCKATTLKAACDHHGGLRAIEIAIRFDSLNSVLKKLLVQDLEQGGDLFGAGYDPLGLAIVSHNNDGLRTFLDFVKEMAETISFPLRFTSTELTASVANQHLYSCEVDWFDAPLHVAAQYGNVSAIELLLEKGANVDGCDSNHFTALECVLTQYFAVEYGNCKEDITCGAAVPLFKLGAATGIFLSWPFMLLLENTSSSAKLLELLLEQTPAACDQKAPPLLDRTTIVSRTCNPVAWDTLVRLQSSIPELVKEDFGGKSFLHHAICWRGYLGLPPCWISELEKMTPFPWHYHWLSLHEMAFLTSDFKLYRRRLPHDTLKRIMNLQPERGISPLCGASSRGILEIMENCLTMGAEIDFEGCSLGSALMIACACGRLDAVKLLVRRGAAISYVGRGGPTSAVIAGQRSKTVIAWLLVGQFNEQGRLTGGDERSSGSEGSGKVCQLWSGVGQAPLRLIGRREMQPHESSLDYVIRVSAMKRNMRGVLIPHGFLPA